MILRDGGGSDRRPRNPLSRRVVGSGLSAAGEPAGAANSPCRGALPALAAWKLRKPTLRKRWKRRDPANAGSQTLTRFSDVPGRRLTEGMAVSGNNPK